MDNSDPSEPRHREPLTNQPAGEVAAWAPKPAFAVCAAAGAVLAAGWLVVTDDPAGRLLAAAAVALLGVLAAQSALVRPRLAADEHGVRIGGWRGARPWPWSAVQRVAVVAHRRFGREVRMLEIDLDLGDGSDRLVVLTALDLGAEPRDVADALERRRPSR